MANEYATSFKEVLKARRMSMGPGNRKKTKNPKSNNWLYPQAQETRMYLKIREKIRKPLVETTNQVLITDLPRWLEEKKRNDGDESFFINLNLDSIVKIDNLPEAFKWDSKNKKIIRNDSWITELNSLISQLRHKSSSFLGADGDNIEGTEVWQVLLGLAAAAIVFNRKQWNKSVRPVLGFDFSTDESWQEEAINAWVSENYNLFKDLNDDYINRINESVYRGVRNDLPYSEIMKEIKDIDQRVFKKRAKLIARDQIGKLNGQLTKKRMAESGLNMYIWRTAFDERVRGRPGGKYPKAIPSHWVMEGKICRWDNASLYAEKSEIKPGKPIPWKPRTGKMPIAHPGEPIQCRCTAIPYFDELIDEVDEEIRKENR